MSRRPSARTVTIRVAPEFAALLRRMGRYAAAGAPFRRAQTGSVTAVSAVLARALASSPMNTPGWWKIPTPGALSTMSELLDSHERAEDGVGDDGYTIDFPGSR